MHSGKGTEPLNSVLPLLPTVVPVKMHSTRTAFWHSNFFLSLQYCLDFKSAQILIFIYELKQWYLWEEDSRPCGNSHLL